MKSFQSFRRYSSPRTQLLCRQSSHVEGGRVYSKGTGLFGCLGHGTDFSDCHAYKPIESIASLPVKSVVAAMGHSAAILTTGKLLLFGRPYELTNVFKINRFSIVSNTLARFVSKMSASSLFGDVVAEPSFLDYFEEPIESLKSTGGLNIILTKSKKVYLLGTSRWNRPTESYSKPYNVQPDDTMKTPQLIPFYETISKVDVGIQHCIILSTEGNIYTVGEGERGQLGDGNFSSNARPAVVSLQNEEKAIDIVAGFHHCAALSTTGNVYVWGKFMSLTPRNPYTQSEIKSIYEDQGKPRPVTLPGNRKATEICGSSVALTIRANDNTLWVMGMAESDNNFHAKPIQVCSYLLKPQVHNSNIGTSNIDNSSNSNSNSDDNNNGNNNDNSNSSSSVRLMNTKDLIQPVILPKEAKLKRGHTRISIIYPKHSLELQQQPIELPPALNPYFTSEPIHEEKGEFKIENINPIYHVALTGNYAFLTPASDLIFQNPPRSKTDITPTQNEKTIEEGTKNHYDLDPKGSYRVIDYSHGWQHSLIVLKEEDDRDRDRNQTMKRS